MHTRLPNFGRAGVHENHFWTAPLYLHRLNQYIEMDIAIAMLNGIAEGGATGAMIGFACGHCLRPCAAGRAEDEIVDCCIGYGGFLGSLTGVNIGASQHSANRQQGKY